jgi:LPXTG-motif cell wall-anchored protein
VTGDRAAGLIAILGAMILVGSALIARRRWPAGRMLPMALTWIAIFAALFAIAHWLDGR